MYKFKIGDEVVRVSIESEVAFGYGRAPSSSDTPIGTVATVIAFRDDDLFDIGDSYYYMLYGDWEIHNFSLENE